MALKPWPIRMIPAVSVPIYAQACRTYSVCCVLNPDVPDDVVLAVLAPPLPIETELPVAFVVTVVEFGLSVFSRISVKAP